MSIKVRNMGEDIIELSVPGVQATSANSAAISTPIAFPGIIKAIYAKLGTAGVTGTQLTDILLNGATLVSSGVLLNFSSGATAATYNTANLNTNPPTVSKGDILSVVTSQVNSGTAAKDLSLAIVIQRLKGTGPTAAVQTDSYGADNDAIG